MPYKKLVLNCKNKCNEMNKCVLKNKIMVSSVGVTMTIAIIAIFPIQE